jgi:hypothetical protein
MHECHDLLHDVSWSINCRYCLWNVHKLSWMFGWSYNDYWTKTLLYYWNREFHTNGGFSSHETM